MIIPETDTPGAKAALVSRTIDLFLNDEEVDTQRQFLEGLAWIDGRSLRQYGKPFVDLPREQQTAFSNLWLTRKIETLRINPAFASLRISRTGRFSDTTLQKSGWSRNCSMGEMLIMSRSPEPARIPNTRAEVQKPL